tara:strand:+ start:2129 stop:2500 length:372 start_codon:yes stop_codon:yes gene_type:complete
VLDCRIVIASILHYELKKPIDEISDAMSKEPATVLHYLEDHSNQYQDINHYTKLYDNTLSQYLKHKDDTFSSDVEEMILKTNYDLDLEKRLEKILNENTKLQHMLEREKIKNRNINKKFKNYA